MTPEISTIIASAIGAVAAIVAALIAKDELWLYIKRAKFDLSGSWQGMSVYLPTETHDIESECVYKIIADIRQSGSRIKFNETITEFFTIDMGKIEKHPSRLIKGKGRVLGERDILIQFAENQSLTCGTMYLTIDTWGKELSGIIAVRNPYYGTPVAVKIVLRRSGEGEVTPDQLGVPRVKSMINAFSKVDVRK